jgi:ribonuclease-3
MSDETEREQARTDARQRLEAWLSEVIDARSVPLLDEALTHPSFANEFRVKDNQRLEFLGDAVLGLCVSEQLARAYPEADEGALTRMRSALVNSQALARWGRERGLGGCLAMGRGASSAADRDQTNVVADAVEAVVAAVYEARGLDGARALVREITQVALEEVVTGGTRDPKSTLQERVQGEGGEAPRYRVVASLGPAHDPRFEVEVFVGEKVLGRGAGRSKRVAERAAAARALEALEGSAEKNGAAGRSEIVQEAVRKPSLVDGPV